jgi:hypothetical protein
MSKKSRTHPRWRAARGTTGAIRTLCALSSRRVTPDWRMGALVVTSSIGPQGARPTEGSARCGLALALALGLFCPGPRPASTRASEWSRRLVATGRSSASASASPGRAEPSEGRALGAPMDEMTTKAAPTYPLRALDRHGWSAARLPTARPDAARAAPAVAATAVRLARHAATRPGQRRECTRHDRNAAGAAPAVAATHGQGIPLGTQRAKGRAFGHAFPAKSGG